jgi:hypothetical protein
MATVICECEKSIPRKFYEEHTKLYCLESVIPCTFFKYGCSWKGKRGAFQGEHYEACQFGILYRENEMLKNKIKIYECDKTLTMYQNSDCFLSTGLTHPDLEERKKRQKYAFSKLDLGFELSFGSITHEDITITSLFTDTLFQPNFQQVNNYLSTFNKSRSNVGTFVKLTFLMKKE